MTDWTEPIKYAELVAIAESVSPHHAYGPAEISQIKNAGYEFIDAIQGSDLATDIDPHLGDVVTFGFVATSPIETVVAIRGTDTILEWLHDGAFFMVPGICGWTEDGFTAVYDSLKIDGLIARQFLSNNFSNSKITISGHSLGAALATLLALDFAFGRGNLLAKVFTFASPRVGEGTFAKAYNNLLMSTTWRIANRQDLVPKLPIFPLPYEHVGTEYELVPQEGQINPSIPCMHYLTSYLWLMKQQAGVASADLGECKFK